MFDGVSYEIPYLGVTITKANVIAYAKAHLGSSGPVLSIFCLVLFFLIMTGIWFYLFLCALCCRCKRSQPANLISARNSLALQSSRASVKSSRMSTSRTSQYQPPQTPPSAPRTSLRQSINTPPPSGRTSVRQTLTPQQSARALSVRKSQAPGSVRASVVPPPVEPSPTKHNFYGGAAFDNFMEEAGPMREQLLLLETRRKKACSSTPCFFIVSVTTILALIICSAVVYVEQTKFDGALRKLKTDADGLTLSTADFLCTSEARQSVCTDASLGLYVQLTGSKTTNALSDLVTYLGSISTILTPINTTISYLDTGSTQLTKLSSAATHINTNVTVLNKYKTYIVAKQSSLSSSVPSTSIPSVSSTQLSYISSGSSTLSTAKSDAQSIYASVNSVITGQVADVIVNMNPETGETAKSLLKPLKQIFTYLDTARNTTMKYHDLMDENAATYLPYLTRKTQAMALIFFLPVVFQILFTLASVKWRRARVHLGMHMCISYFCVLIFLFLSMLFSLFAVLTSTVCEYHTHAIDVMPVNNVTIGDTRISFGPPAVKKILDCRTTSTVDDNFIEILGAQKVFNLTTAVASATSAITSAKSSFNPKTDVQKAIDQLSGMNNLTSFNATKTAAKNITTFRTQLSSLKHTLPPTDFDRTNTTYQTSLKAYYLTSSYPTFSWGAYQNRITALNAILSGCDVPVGYRNYYTFATMKNMTYSAVSADANWGTWTCTGGKSQSDVLNALQASNNGTDAYTLPVNAAVSTNNEVQTNLTAMVTGVGSVQTSLSSLDAAQHSLLKVKSNVNTTLYTILHTANGILTGLDTQKSSIESIATFIATAPDYTKCGFVGDFYHDGFKGGICKKFRVSLESVWPAMICAAIFMFITFVTFSCHVRKPAWHPDNDHNLVLNPATLRPVAVI